MGLFTELGRHPASLRQLFEEVKDVDTSDIKIIANLTFLNACIDETLRLYPALMTGGTRMTTENGMMVAGKFIPPHTNIVAPQYIISRSAFLPSTKTFRYCFLEKNTINLLPS